MGFSLVCVTLSSLQYIGCCSNNARALHAHAHVLAQWCLTLRPRGLYPPSSSVHGILQARILEWVAISSSRGSFQPRDQTCVSCIAGEFFTTEPSGKPCMSVRHVISPVARFRPTARLLGLPLGFLNSYGHPL